MADRLVVIVGPTAVGKSALALGLCERFEGEIVSADSRQIYRGLDIGTAKPMPQERARVPHHLVDIIPPDRRFSLAEYQELAYRAIADIQSRGRLPFLVGGTGQYVRAVVEGWSIPCVPPHPDLRQRMRQEAQEEGREALHSRLEEVDPAAAAEIDPRNLRRVIRALEVYEVTGQPISELQGKNPPPYRILQLGLTMEREALYERADQRIERMLDRGLLDEVRRLLEQGYDPSLSSMSGIGYAELARHLEGKISLQEAIRRMKSNTRRFIRHQYNWFKPDDPQIHWIEQGAQLMERAAAIIRRWLREADEQARVHLGLGTNLGDRKANLREALRRLEERIAVETLSALYETPPMGPSDQPWYLNAACCGATELKPRELLAFVKEIEQEMGRVPTVRWGPRVIDIDILFYDDMVMNTPELIIPHPGVSHRPFVLVPLADIAPQFIHPQLKEPISALLKGLSSDLDEVRKVAEPEEWYPCMR
ncbi:MAG: tRNA (adenosine(37)-N6)-dimethylallyltransferase MiaA [Chloroflexota bacterium]|nr:tRNA (adenosine(37)-N6)-dimethylallyltransferase MiaA [Chloroflexota bacterium]